MSESDTESAEEYETKEQFIEAVREDGAVIGDTEFFAEGSGSSIRYKARDNEGEVESIIKSDAVEAWEEAHNGESEQAEEEEEDDGPEEVHLGTFYMASSWEDRHREAFEEALDDLDWFVGGEVDSGGLRVFTEE